MHKVVRPFWEQFFESQKRGVCFGSTLVNGKRGFWEFEGIRFWEHFVQFQRLWGRGLFWELQWQKRVFGSSRNPFLAALLGRDPFWEHVVQFQKRLCGVRRNGFGSTLFNSRKRFWAVYEPGQGQRNCDSMRRGAEMNNQAQQVCCISCYLHSTPKAWRLVCTEVWLRACAHQGLHWSCASWLFLATGMSGTLRCPTLGMDVPQMQQERINSFTALDHYTPSVTQGQPMDPCLFFSPVVSKCRPELESNSHDGGFKAFGEQATVLQ